MSFKYDEEKSVVNQAKYGIDFTVSQALWNDPNRIEIPARELDEPRSLVIGKIGGKHWPAVITYRNDNIRLISVRRSRKEEIGLYESF